MKPGRAWPSGPPWIWIITGRLPGEPRRRPCDEAGDRRGRRSSSIRSASARRIATRRAPRPVDSVQRATRLPANVEHVDVARALRRVEVERERGRIRVPLDAAHRADRHLRARQLAARVRIEEPQHADARLVDDHRDRAAVARERELLDVPVRRAEGLERAGGEIEVARTLELAVAVGREEQSLAVAREVDFGRRDGPRRIGARCRQHAPALAGREVHHPDVGLGDRPELAHREPAVVEREAEIAPARSRKRRDLLRACRRRADRRA